MFQTIALKLNLIWHTVDFIKSIQTLCNYQQDKNWICFVLLENDTVVKLRNLSLINGYQIFLNLCLILMFQLVHEFLKEYYPGAKRSPTTLVKMMAAPSIEPDRAVEGNDLICFLTVCVSLTWP